MLVPNHYLKPYAERLGITEKEDIEEFGRIVDSVAKRRLLADTFVADEFVLFLKAFPQPGVPIIDSVKALSSQILRV